MAPPSLVIVSGEADRDRAALALEALDHMAQTFARVSVIAVAADPPTDHRPTTSEQAHDSAWGDAIALALASDADWLFVVAPGERINPTTLAQAGPLFDSYDAIWGGIAVEPDGNVPALARYTGHAPVDAPHMALVWWIGRSHFIRLSVAREMTAQRLGAALCCDDGSFASYLMTLWRHRRCLKTVQPFTQAEALPQLPTSEREAVQQLLRNEPLFMRFNAYGHSLALPYTGRNPTIERVQMRGQFYEQRDLEALIALVPSQTTIIDIGANTGNHTLFFARTLNAARVVPVEPNPDTIHALQQTIAANGLTNIDRRWLGYGVSAARGSAHLQTGRRGHLGTARLTADAAGATPLVSLDEIVAAYADEQIGLIKIDVEANELAVLAGAEQTLRSVRPIILIEVMDDNIMSFHAIVISFGYAVAAVFADAGYANYVLVPSEVAK